MSKIEKALERATTMRQKSEQKVHDASGVQETDGVQSREPREPRENVYTETKVISLNEGHLEKQRVMTLVDNPGAKDQYNLLRTQVLSRTREKKHNTLMITSALDGEGKTVTAINLAVSIAREVKQTVLVVDADLRHPKIHTYLGFDMEKGLSDYLQEEIAIADLLVNPGLANMVVLPAGKPLLGSTEILGSPKMEALVAEMKRRYPDRYVIFDCPPLLTVPDSLVFSSYVDGVIFVVEAGRTPRDQIRKAMDLVKKKNIVGLVMNRADESHSGYYY